MHCLLPRIQATNLVLWCSRRYVLSFHFILLIVCHGIAHPSTNYSGQLLVQYLHRKEAARSNNTERATTSLHACIGPMHSKNRHQREVGRDGSGGQTLRAGVLNISCVLCLDHEINVRPFFSSSVSTSFLNQGRRRSHDHHPLSNGEHMPSDWEDFVGTVL